MLGFVEVFIPVVAIIFVFDLALGALVGTAINRAQRGWGQQ